jgi:hypothetical protein
LLSSRLRNGGGRTKRGCSGNTTMHPARLLGIVHPFLVFVLDEPPWDESHNEACFYSGFRIVQGALPAECRCLVWRSLRLFILLMFIHLCLFALEMWFDSISFSLFAGKHLLLPSEVKLACNEQCKCADKYSSSMFKGM